MVNESSNTVGNGILVGILLVIAIIAFMYMSGRDGISNSTPTPSTVTTGNNEDETSVVVPEEIDVNLNQGQEGQ